MAEEETGQELGEAPKYWWIVILAFFALLIFSTIISQYYKIGEKPSQPEVREPEIITEEPIKEEVPKPKEEKVVEEDTVDVDLAEKFYQEGVNFILAGNYPVALELFERILEEYPDSPYAEYANPLHKICRELISVHDDLVEEKIKNITRERAAAKEKKKDDRTGDFIKKTAQGCGSLLLVIISVGLFACIF